MRRIVNYLIICWAWLPVGMIQSQRIVFPDGAGDTYPIMRKMMNIPSSDAPATVAQNMDVDSFHSKYRSYQQTYRWLDDEVLCSPTASVCGLNENTSGVVVGDLLKLGTESQNCQFYSVCPQSNSFVSGLVCDDWLDRSDWSVKLIQQSVTIERVYWWFIWCVLTDRSHFHKNKLKILIVRNVPHHVKMTLLFVDACGLFWWLPAVTTVTDIDQPDYDRLKGN